MTAPLSVVICCANAEDTLEAACRSVAWADELVIVDSGSHDRTPEIAQRHATRYVVEPWRGYTEQKKYGCGLATHDWVLLLDGDEECSAALAAQWRAMPAEALEATDLFLVPRRNYVLGCYARAWSPDWQSRVFRRDRVTWPAEALHDARRAAPERTGRLTGWLDHKRHSAAGFSDYFSGRRMDERLLPVARQMYDRGKRARWWDLAFRPAMAFLKFYVFKAGFRDGVFGLLIAQKAASSVQLKYAALWSVQRAAASASAGPQPAS